MRGEINGDCSGLVSDAVFLFNSLYRSVPAWSCLDAGDVNDDGHLDIADVSYFYIVIISTCRCFTIPPPFGSCDRPGEDPTADGITCTTYDQPLPSPPEGRDRFLTLGFEGFPEEVAGAPGEEVTLDGFAVLRTTNPAAACDLSLIPGVCGPTSWSLSFTASEAMIGGATAAGVLTPALLHSCPQEDCMPILEDSFDLDLGETASFTDLASHPGDARAGAVSGLFLESSGKTNSLDPKGPMRLARLTVVFTIPEGEDCITATIAYEDGFQSENQLFPVHNVLGFSGRHVFPALGSSTVRLCPRRPPRFLRGDCDGDGEVRGIVTDAVYLLTYNFLGGPEPQCVAACDVNGDGDVRGVVTDAVYLLSYNFLGGPPPVRPFPACGPGELATDESLGCGTPLAECAERG